MGLKLDERSASRSYMWQRKIKPFLRDVLPLVNLVVLGCVFLGAFQKQTVTVVKNTFFQWQPNGTIIVFGDTKDEVFKDWCEINAKSIAESFAQYARGDDKVFSARIDKIYSLVDEGARSDLTREMELVLARIPKESTRIESSLIETVYDSKRDTWIATFAAKILVEDEARRQVLRKFSLGLECLPVIPSLEYKHAGRVTKIKITTQEQQ